MKDARNVISIKWGENTEYFSTQSIYTRLFAMLYQQLLMGVHYQLDVFQQVIWLLVGSHTLFMRKRDPFFFSLTIHVCTFGYSFNLPSILVR